MPLSAMHPSATPFPVPPLVLAGPERLGLTWEQARERLAVAGPNAVIAERRLQPALRFVNILFSPLLAVLMILAVISWLTGATTGAVVIVSMVVLASGMRFIQEYRSEKAVELLRSMVSTTCRVIRWNDSRPQALEIPIGALVPGDLVQMSAGDLIAADIRLIESKEFYVDEAPLTGESLPVEKLVFAPPAQTPPPTVTAGPARRTDLCFMGTHCVGGSALGLVTATGMHTEFGQTAAEIAAARKHSHFDQSVGRFVWMMIRVTMLIVPLLLFINGFVRQEWLEALLFATAVAVGLTPEMLPMIITLNLSRGAMAMSRHRVIVKRLSAIQELGSMTILCTDKTGTLTQDRIILVRTISPSEEPTEAVLQLAYLNSLHQTGLRNLLDDAILSYVAERRLFTDALPAKKIDEVPFDFERRRMSVVIERADGSHVLICKGSAEELLGVCSDVSLQGIPKPLDQGERERQQGIIRSLQGDGFRAIGVAIRHAPANQLVFKNTDEEALTLMGYVCFLDPPKESTPLALKELGVDGVEIKILTGDSPYITVRISKDVGLAVTTVLTGPQIDTLDDAELGRQAEGASIFAQLSPRQKARIIAALRARGHVVGFLGDGINDGPALKSADVGISVDSATEIARESADIILMEKNLTVLHRGVLEGRRVFGNLVKYLKISASSSFGNVLSLAGASTMLPFLPMAPTQLLLNNLLFDVSQTAVPTDGVDRRFLSVPQEWRIEKLTTYMVRMGLASSVFDYLTFFVLWYGFEFTTAAQARQFQTAWFVESLLSQTLLIHAIRHSAYHGSVNRPSAALVIATTGVCTVGLLLPYSPVAPLFSLEPLAYPVVATLLLIVLGYLLTMRRIHSAIHP